MKELKSKNILCLVLVLICSVLLISRLSWAAEENQNSQLQLAGVDSSDRLEVVWTEATTEGQYGLYYSMYKKQAWQPKQLVLQSDNLLITPCIGGSGDQGNILVWSEQSENSTDLYYSLYKNGAWTSPQKIETNLVSNLSPSLLVDAVNQTWLAWVGSEGRDDDIYFSRWNGSNWDAPVQVNEDNDTPDLFPVLGIGSGGNPYIQWYGYENGKYTQFRRDWNGTSWEQRQEMTGRAVALAGFSLRAVETGSEMVTSAAEKDGSKQTSIDLPSFLPKPERATIHVLGSTSGIQSLPLRDLYAE